MSELEKQKQQTKELLKLHWGYDSFRLGQEKAISAVLEGKSTVVIMPTGGGKSLCYQLPALVLEGVTIVISPLIALMKDQVDSLTKIGIPATFINSSISQQETYNRLESVKQGGYKLLYIAPERFYNEDFTKSLASIKVSLFAIDEAHCISQWGHDFRPSYTRLKRAVELCGHPPILALTATATPEVKEDIIAQLGLINPEMVITGFARPNLQFGVIQAKDAQKPQYILDCLKSLPEASGIIYVSTRARVDGLLEILLENDIEAAGYHAGMDQEDRKWVQNNFLENKVKVIIATNAFGLGIDKPDVRFVIHYDMPGTVEAYYQEAGRAGRDGKQSYCLLLYNSRDRILHEFFIKGDNPSVENIQEIYQTLLNFEQDSVMVTYAELAGLLSENIPEMAIGTSLKILEKQNVIFRSKEKNSSAFIKIISDFEAIKSALGKKAKKAADIVSLLEEKYRSQLLEGLNISLEEMAAVLNVKKDSLLRVIKKLAADNLAEYQPPFKGTEIKILKRLDRSELELDKKTLKNKLNKAFEKLEKMEDYVFTLDCRQKYILDYFGDFDSADCGLCDSCLAKRGYARKTETPNREERPESSAKKFSHKSQATFDKKLKHDKEYEAKEPDASSGLSTKLTQLETMDLYIKGMKIPKIAEIRGVKEETIIDHIAYLIEKKIFPLETIDKLVNKDKKEKILASAKKVGQEKLKLIFEDLGGAIDYGDIKLVVAGLKRK